ncbi:hypothetical protein DIPPA_22675 [Diplonema papillatum]|nr:hypothetical protein DIPPA_22675 [Diplonema papillatum]
MAAAGDTLFLLSELAENATQRIVAAGADYSSAVHVVPQAEASWAAEDAARAVESGHKAAIVTPAACLDAVLALVEGTGVGVFSYGGDSERVMVVDDESVEMLFDPELWEPPGAAEGDEDGEADDIETEEDDRVHRVSQQLAICSLKGCLRFVEQLQQGAVHEPVAIVSLLDADDMLSMERDVVPYGGGQGKLAGAPWLQVTMRDTAGNETELLRDVKATLDWMDAVLRGGEAAYVLVHCRAGVSRSAAMVACHLMRTAGLGCADALQQIRDARPWISPNSAFVRQLDIFDAVLHRPTDQSRRLVLAAGLHDAAKGVTACRTDSVSVGDVLRTCVGPEEGHLGVVVVTACERRSLGGLEDAALFAETGETVAGLRERHADLGGQPEAVDVVSFVLLHV